MRRWSTILVLFCSFAVGVVRATQPQTWRADTYEEFLDGRLNGLAATLDGRLVPAPALVEVASLGDPYVLCAVAHPDGSVFFGTGHEGKVYKLGKRGGLELVFDAGEPDIFALAVGPDGTVYAGAGPGGKVYRSVSGGAFEAFADLGSKYIWSLAAATDGTVYAGTGIEGKIFRIRNGVVEEFFDSAQVHIMCLALDGDQNLLAGTAPNGHVLRVSPTGKGNVLFDAPFQEVHAIKTDGNQSVYALAMGAEPDEEKSADSADDPSQQVFAPGVKRKKSRGAAEEIFGSTGSKTAAGALYRIGRDMDVRTLWWAADVKAFAFVLEGDGDVLLGTGDNGRIAMGRGDRPHSTVAETGQEQVTAMLNDPDGKGVLVWTSNLGKMFRLGPSLVNLGEYVSDVADTGGVSRIGSFYAETCSAGSSDRKFFLRAGNTKTPDQTWTDWQAVTPDGVLKMPGAKLARYVQAKATLSSAGAPLSSFECIESLEFHYQQQNQSPRLTSLTVNPASIAFQETPAMPSATGVPSFGEHSTLSLPDALLNAVTRQSINVALNRIYRPGSISLSWSAVDPNDDQLEYAIETRDVESETWTTLEKELRETNANIGINRLGDGKHVFRVTVSDAPSNPLSAAREDRLVSRVITVDTAPPAIRSLKATRSPDGLSVSFSAVDALSPIYWAECSTDGGGRWQALLPEDGLCDSAEESYAVEIAGAASAGSVVVRVMDSAGNANAAAVEVAPGREK